MIGSHYDTVHDGGKFDGALGIITMKKTIWAARINVMTKGMEFVRVVYGSIRTKLMVVIMYVCQECGYCFKYDYDDYVLEKRGQASGWYCSCCGGRCDKAMMHGAVGVRIKEAAGNGFMAKITVPT